MVGPDHHHVMMVFYNQNIWLFLFCWPGKAPSKKVSNLLEEGHKRRSCTALIPNGVMFIANMIGLSIILVDKIKIATVSMQHFSRYNGLLSCSNTLSTEIIHYFLKHIRITQIKPHNFIKWHRPKLPPRPPDCFYLLLTCIICKLLEAFCSDVLYFNVFL